MQPIERFSNRVEDYVRHRPSYPPAVIELMRREMNLNENSIIADIGSGTGFFTKMLLETGCTVYGVEPNALMRVAGENYLKDFSRFVSVSGGSAENTNLPAASVDFITAAQAFHWFDREKTKTEFRRISKSGGHVILIWNERQLNSTPFLRDYENLLLKFGTDYQQVRHDNVSVEEISRAIEVDFRQDSFLNVQTVDFEGLRGRLLSASYVPRAGHPSFEGMLLELKQIFARHEQAGRVEILYDTKVFYGIL